VERITKTLAGDVSYEATHFPIDDQGRSLIALDVAAAVGTGIILPSGRTGVSCDVNSSSDNTIPAETFTYADGADPLELSPSGGGLGFNDSAPTGDTGNADDGLDGALPPNILFPANMPAGIGSALYPFADATGPCGSSGNIESITWYKDDVKIVTIQRDSPGGSFEYVPEPGQYVPSFVSTVSAIPGVLVVGDQGAGTYKSITRCFNGSQQGSATVVSSNQPYAPVTTCGNARYAFKMSNNESLYYASAGSSPFVEYVTEIATGQVFGFVRGRDCNGNIDNSWGVISWNLELDGGVGINLQQLQTTPNSGATWTTYVDYTNAP
jgi:hypothetical protein